MAYDIEPADADRDWLLRNIDDPDENEIEFFQEKVAILLADGKRDEQAVRVLVKQQLLDKRRHGSKQFKHDKANIKNILR